jgi:hypothetical protein
MFKILKELLLNFFQDKNSSKRPKIEYIDANSFFFDSKKTHYQCENWVLSEKEYYYYDGFDFKKLEMIIYELNYSTDYIPTPSGIILHPCNIFFKNQNNQFNRTSKKLKIIV